MNHGSACERTIEFFRIIEHLRCPLTIFRANASSLFSSNTNIPSLLPRLIEIFQAGKSNDIGISKLEL